MKKLLNNLKRLFSKPPSPASDLMQIADFERKFKRKYPILKNEIIVEKNIRKSGKYQRTLYTTASGLTLSFYKSGRVKIIAG